MGKDTSGNGNNLTPNNFGATNGFYYPSYDTPTNNFCVLNDNDFNGGNLAQGKLRHNNGGSSNVKVLLWVWKVANPIASNIYTVRHQIVFLELE